MKKGKMKQLHRIERKCDIILHELRLSRKTMKQPAGTDAIIDDMHRTARRLREQCKREKELIVSLTNSIRSDEN